MPITSFAVNFAATRGGAGEGVGRSTRMSCAAGVGGGGRLVGTCNQEKCAAGEFRRFFWTGARVSAILEHLRQCIKMAEQLLHLEPVHERLSEMIPSHYAVAKRPTCSPCNFNFTDQPITVRDDPYDTERCEPWCVGKWSYALRRFAGYLAREVQDNIGAVRTLMERSGLYFADHVYNNIDVHSELSGGTQR